jgi:uroporphyrinogen decarboxylase
LSSSPSERGKSLLLSALRHEPITAVPWVPFAGVHAGKLKGYNAQEVLTDGDKLLASLLEVNRLYAPDGQPVLFDLQIEAEILGCPLVWAVNSPPSVASHPLAETMEIPTRLPERSDGRLPLVLDVMRRMKELVGERTALFGLVCGPLTLASHLRGTEVFMDLILQPEYAKKLLAYTRDVSLRMTEMYLDAGMDVIAVVDPLVSQISPRHFRDLLSEPMTSVFDAIRASAALSSFFVCGDATKNIELMCKTGPDSIGIDENIDLAAAKEITDRYNVTLCGNIPLTTIILMGTQQDNMKFVVDVLESVHEPNYVLAPGCDMPYDTPIENVIGIVEAVRDPEKARRMLASYDAIDRFDLPIELPDYAHLTVPLVEVFTLDSASCAACSYMYGAAHRAVQELGKPIDIVEYKFTEPENVARCRKLGVKNLPSIYINGELKYSSIIPSNDELLAEISRSIAVMAPR